MVKERKLTGEWQGFYPGDWVRPRSNPGTWMPLIDVVDVFPGNRSVSRQGEYNLYDAPVGVEHKIEEATKVPMTFDGEVEWEAEGIGALYMWQEDGKHHLLYYTSGDHVCYAVSDNAYHWIRPELGEVEYNGSRKNNLLGQPPSGAEGHWHWCSGGGDRPQGQWLRQNQGLSPLAATQAHNAPGLPG